MAEEALNDALKHAAATAVDVRIGGDECSLQLEIRHNGQGFLSAPDSAPNAGGLGLARMREQVQNLGGTFVVETNPGRGTTVRVTLEREKRENGKIDPHPHL